MNTWEDVCQFLLTLPGVERDPPGDREVVRVRGTVLAYPARNERSRPPGYPPDEAFVIVKVDRAERTALLAETPEAFFVTPHYESYPGVIVRLAAVSPEQLRELLTDAWRQAAPKSVAREWEQSRSA